MVAGQQGLKRFAGLILKRCVTDIRRELRPHLSRMNPSAFAVGAALGRSDAYYISSPAPAFRTHRHYPNLAALVGVGRLLRVCLVSDALRPFDRIGATRR